MMQWSKLRNAPPADPDDVDCHGFRGSAAGTLNRGRCGSARHDWLGDHRRGLALDADDLFLVPSVFLLVGNYTSPRSTIGEKLAELQRRFGGHGKDEDGKGGTAHGERVPAE